MKIEIKGALTTQDLIQFVEEAQNDNWANSDLWAETQTRLEAMAEHYSFCSECAENFDCMEYSDFFELEEKIGSSKLEDWICEKTNKITVETLEEKLSHGSGINGKWYIEDMGQYFRCENCFETLSEHGYYDIDVWFQLIIPKHDPKNFRLHFQGKRSQYGAYKYMLRGYLEDVFAEDIRTILNH